MREACQGWRCSEQLKADPGNDLGTPAPSPDHHHDTDGDDDDADNDDDDDADGDDELEVVELLGRVTSYLISASLTIAMLSSIPFFGNSIAVQ